MPKNPGRVCTHCTRRLTDPCDGANVKCPYYNSKRRNYRNLLWIPVIFILSLLVFGCEQDHYEQITPITCVDRDTGYVVVFNRWAHLPDDTLPVIRIKGTFYENACEAGVKRKLLPITAPTLSYWKDVSAANKFEKCKEK